MGELAIEWVPIESIRPYPQNPRVNAPAIPKVAESIEAFGWRQPIVCDPQGEIIAGHTRWEAARHLGLKEVPVHRAELSPEEARQYRLADNRTGEEAKWDVKMLKVELSDLHRLDPTMLKPLGFDLSETDKLLRPPILDRYSNFEHGALTKRFGMPPFSILDARGGAWQERKREWKDRMVRPLATRERALQSKHDGSFETSKSVWDDHSSAVSLMDPVVCELVLRWFSQPGYKAFDPFSGDCSFGFVAAALGMDFRGIELRQEQVDTNLLTLRTNGLEGEYICDDALELEKHIEPLSQDFIFSCPPYADLEKYSDDPRDLSNMSHKDFRDLLGRSLQMLYSRLRDNRFAVIVISDVRSEGGGYMRLPQFVAEEMCDSGFALWNEIILINAVSTLGLRASRQMQARRKVGRTHQLILVFYKGDQAQIKPVFGDVWRLPGQEPEEEPADAEAGQPGNGADPGEGQGG